MAKNPDKEPSQDKPSPAIQEQANPQQKPFSMRDGMDAASEDLRNSAGLGSRREELEKDIAHCFTYHPVRPGQDLLYVGLREMAKQLALAFARYTPRCPEQTLALRKLEEAIMWANAAIARRG